MFPNGVPGKSVYVVQNEIEGKKLTDKMGGQGTVLSFNLEELTDLPSDEDPEVLRARRYLQKHKPQELAGEDPQIDPTGMTVEELIPQIKKVISRHCIDPQKRTLRDYAQLAGSSPRYLSTLIKRSEKCPFSVFEAHMKIERTLPLITNTNIPIIKIANLCHYRNANQYNRIFKAYTGTTPTQYRRDHRNESVNDWPSGAHR